MTIAVVCTLLLVGGVGGWLWRVHSSRREGHTAALDEQRAREHARPLTAVHVIHPPPQSLPAESGPEPVQFDGSDPAKHRK